MANLAVNDIMHPPLSVWPYCLLSGWSTVAVAGAILIMMCAWTYRYIEYPTMRWPMPGSRRAESTSLRLDDVPAVPNIRQDHE